MGYIWIIYRECRVQGDISPIVENHMENNNKMEHLMETGILFGALYRHDDQYYNPFGSHTCTLTQATPERDLYRE